MTIQRWLTWPDKYPYRWRVLVHFPIALTAEFVRTGDGVLIYAIHEGTQGWGNIKAILSSSAGPSDYNKLWNHFLDFLPSLVAHALKLFFLQIV
jgi:hypothetical protein